MAYRRKQGMAKVSTLQQDFDFHSSSLIKDSNSNGINVTHTSSSSLTSHPTFQDHHDPQRSKSFDAFGGIGRDEAKGGFWGVLAQKAKSIIDDNKSSSQHHQNLKPTSSNNTNTYTPSQFKPLPDSANRKMENPKFRKGLDAITSSLNQLGDTFEKAFEEGRTIVENKRADLRTQMRPKGNVPDHDSNTNPQLKASRDVAMATAAKAKLLVRELKTVKADLAFAKARCAQLEEQSKLLRDKEGSHNGHDNDNDNDDLIRVQLETLVAEKARLANENEIYCRENRFLREIVEYHQLTMQNVVYLDEGIEELSYIYPLHSSSSSSLSSPPPTLTKEEVSSPSHHTK